VAKGGDSERPPSAGIQTFKLPLELGDRPFNSSELVLYRVSLRGTLIEEMPLGGHYEDEPKVPNERVLMLAVDLSESGELP
jgi:hypothetical protein